MLSNTYVRAVRSYCVGDTPGLLSGTSIEGITGTWTPARNQHSRPQGRHHIRFTPDGGQCATTTTMTVVVNAE